MQISQVSGVVQIQARTVEDLAEVLRETNAGCSLLIGAGCSKSAGIPLASEFVKIIQEKHQLAYARAADPKEYPQCMAQLDHGLRRDLIAKYVDKASLNWAHIGIARLFQAGYVRRILTTNFDPLVVRSCGLLGEFPAVYDLAVSGQFRPADIPEKAVLYLHGQHTGFVLLNTEEETKRHAARLTPIFDDAMRRRVWIVVGYSGASDPIVEDLLAKVPRFDYGLYWVTYKDSMPPASVQEKLLGDPEKNAYLVQGEDADTFFIKLTQAMGKFPPEIIDKPFSVLASQLRKLPPYPVSGGEGQDVTGIQLQRIDKAIQEFEHQGLPEEVGGGGGDHLSREMLDSVTLAAQRLLMAGDHEGVLKLRWAWEKSRDEKLRDVLVGATIGTLEDLVKKAVALSPNRARKRYAEAEALYRAALEMGGHRSDLLVARGDVLRSRAERGGAESKELLEEAVAQYEAAHLIPMDRAWTRWCHAVHSLADLADPDVAAPLYADVAAMWEQAIAQDPNNEIALYNSGLAMYRAFQLKEGQEAGELLDRAIKRFRSVLSLRPDNLDAIGYLSLSLFVWAKFAEGAEAAARVAEAEELLRVAEGVGVGPGNGAYNIACVHALLDHPDQCRIWLEASLQPNMVTRKELLGDPDLATVRDLDWFKEIVERTAEE